MISMRPTVRQKLDALPYAQRQRLQFVESVAQWEGVVQRQRICDVFRVTPNHVTRDLSLYRTLSPDNLEYDVSRRAYRRSARFKPLFSSGSAAEYLSILRFHLDMQASANTPQWVEGVPVAGLPIPAGLVDAEVLRTLTQALREQCMVEIRYAALHTGVAPTQRIVPSRLIDIGGRWLVRAFHVQSDAFADLLLTRISAASALAQPVPDGATDDADWHHEVNIDVVPHPRLTSTQQAVVARDYGMAPHGRGWRWSVVLRHPLVPYFLEHHQLLRPNPRGLIAVQNLKALGRLATAPRYP